MVSSTSDTLIGLACVDLSYRVRPPDTLSNPVCSHWNRTALRVHTHAHTRTHAHSHTHTHTHTHMQLASSQVLSILNEELVTVMQLSGTPTVSDITSSHIRDTHSRSLPTTAVGAATSAWPVVAVSAAAGFAAGVAIAAAILLRATRQH
jgi:hypothetical protein